MTAAELARGGQLTADFILSEPKVAPVCNTM
jgi:hypothetical protein